jgi:hypothetical protein
MMAPVMMSAPAPTPFLPQGYAPPQGYAQPAPRAQASMPAVPARPPAPRAAARAPEPVVRGVPPDEPPPRREREPLAMPSPQQLGIHPPTSPAGVDWTATHNRLKELGVVGVHVETLPGGGCRLTCWLPRPQPGVRQRIEAQAPSEAEAIRLCLDRVQHCRTAQP